MLWDKTLKELLTDPLIKDIAPYAIKNWDFSDEEFYDWTLRKIADDMGWKNPESGFERLFEVARRGNYFFRLYSDAECEGFPEKESTNLVYIPSDDPEASGRPYIFLVPGGGFYNVWNMTEGWPIARIFNELGYNAFILTYQVDVEGSAVRAMDDMARAFKIIAERKDEFNVDPDKYITCGFSAGGYTICLWNTEKGYRAFNLPKPQACFPIYPFVSYRILDAEEVKEPKEGEEPEDKEEIARWSVGCSVKEACESCFEIPEHVEGFPPTALFAAAEDDLVPPDHSRNLAVALDKAGIPCRLEIGPTGGHGFADGEGMCMEGWPKRAIEWVER